MPFITTGALQGFCQTAADDVPYAVVLLHAGVFQAAKKSERTVRAYTVPPRCSHRLYSTVAKCWRIAGCAAIPAEQAGRSRKPPAPFSFGGADAHLIYRLRCRWPAHILRSQQPRTAAAPQRPVEHTRTRDSDLRHAGCSRRFQPHRTAFGADNLPAVAPLPRGFSV